jgi:hypothetical protein
MGSMTTRRTGLVLLVGSALLLAGCGSGSGSGAAHATTSATSASAASGTATSPASAKTVPGTTASDAAQVEVIQEWATALQSGHIEAAARYFALPSIFANGDGVGGLIDAVRVKTLHEAEIVNESLSCGAALVSTKPNGKYILATFTLTNRKGPGADCGSGTGASAATDFVVKDGRIVDWIRAPTNSVTPTITVPPTATNPPGQGGQV